MLREDRFVMSHKQYAVDLSALRTVKHTRPNGTHYGSGRINAVWFRRRKGVTVACLGDLWDTQDSVPQSALEFLERHDDGRYGGDCEGRWDGTGYWGAENPDEAARHLALLKPMLDSYTQDPKNPQVPDKYDGWWRF